MFEQLLRFLLSLPPKEFAHWRKAGAFLVEGKSSLAELDIRLVNLFVFLEMFDGARGLSGQALAKMLDIPLSDAKVACETRNRLIHERHTLNAAIADADAQLARHDKAHALQSFDLSGRIESPGVMFTFRMCERINRFICRQIGWNQSYYDYGFLLSRKP
jgi:hypothetical protein